MRQLSNLIISIPPLLHPKKTKINLPTLLTRKHQTRNWLEIIQWLISLLLLNKILVINILYQTNSINNNKLLHKVAISGALLETYLALKDLHRQSRSTLKLVDPQCLIKGKLVTIDPLLEDCQVPSKEVKACKWKI